MAIITDVQAEAGFNVMIRWFAKASQRYPANENEYFFSQFEMLEPNQQFTLTDPRFNPGGVLLPSVDDPAEELEYTIRDICYVQTLVPQFVGFTYIQPDHRQRASLTAAANQGTNTLEIQYDVTGFQFADTDTILLGPLPNDTYGIDTIVHRTVDPMFPNQFATVTLSEPLRRTYIQGVAVGQFPLLNDVNTPGNTPNEYPDNSPAAASARVFDNNGNLRTDPVEVNTPIFFDTSETVLRYYYDSALENPWNGARGPGRTTDQMVLHNGQMIAGGWWALGDMGDNTAANRAALISDQGFVLDVRVRPFFFDLDLSYSTTEVGACNETNTTRYYGDHSNFRGQLSDPADFTTYIPGTGTEDFINTDGSSPVAGYYAWTSTLPGDAGQRFVKYWNGTAFEEGRVGAGIFDSCPLALANSVTVQTYSVEQDLACGNRGTTRTIWFESSTNTFTAGNVTAIYTDEFGPNAANPSLLGATFINEGGNRFTWNGTDLQTNTAACAMNRYCGDPNALNTGTGDIRDDSLCVFPRNICANPAATNFVPADMRQSTDILHMNAPVCSFTPQFTATYDLTLNIDGPLSGRTVTINSDTQDDGATYNISYSVVLADGFEWVNQPSNLTGSATGTFAGANVTESVTIPPTGRGELRRIPNAPAGCNVSTAHNYTAGSDGSVHCYYTAGSFFSAASDTAVCDGFNEGNTSRRTLYTTNSNGSFGNGDTLYGLRNGVYSPAGSGFFTSDGMTYFQLSSGTVSNRSSICPLPVRFSAVEFIRSTERVNLNQEAAFQLQFNYTGTLPAGTQYRFTGPTSDASETGNVFDVGNGIARSEVAALIFTVGGTHNLLGEILDSSGSVLGRSVVRVQVVTGRFDGDAPAIP